MMRITHVLYQYINLLIKRMILTYFEDIYVIFQKEYVLRSKCLVGKCIVSLKYFQIFQVKLYCIVSFEYEKARHATFLHLSQLYKYVVQCNNIVIELLIRIILSMWNAKMLIIVFNLFSRILLSCLYLSNMSPKKYNMYLNHVAWYHFK